MYSVSEAWKYSSTVILHDDLVLEANAQVPTSSNRNRRWPDAALLVGAESMSISPSPVASVALAFHPLARRRRRRTCALSAALVHARNTEAARGSWVGDERCGARARARARVPLPWQARRCEAPHVQINRAVNLAGYWLTAKASGTGPGGGSARLCRALI